MADVFGRIGDAGVELNNAATEATLRLILQATLATTKKQKEAIADLARRAGLDPVVIEQVNSELRQGLTAQEKYRTAVDFVTAAFDNLRPVIDGVQAAMSSIISGSNNVSDVFNAFSGLPGPLGLAASGFGLLNKLQEEAFESYQKMTNAGVNFGGSINQTRIMASNMGLSFDQLAGLMNKNSETLSKLGGGTEKAAMAFARLSKDMIGSGTGDHLRALGFTTEQVNQGMLNYLAITGPRTRKEMANTDQLIAHSATYMESLDGLARVTGKSREQQEEALKEAAKNAQFEAYLMTLDENSRKKAQDALMIASATHGKAGIDIVMSRLMNIVPDKPGQILMATMSKTAAKLEDLASQVENGSIKAINMSANTTGIMSTQAQDIKKFGTQLGYALGRSGDAVGQQIAASQALANQFNTMGIAGVEEALKKRETAKTEAENAVINEKKMMVIRDALLTSLNDLRVKYSEPMQEILDGFLLGIKSLTVYIKENGEMIKNVLIGMTAVWAAWKAVSGVASVVTVVRTLAGPTATAAAGAGGVAGGGIGGAIGGAGKGMASSIKRIGMAFAALGRPQIAAAIAIGAGAVAIAIAEIGLGIAAASWMTGKALPTLTEGLAKMAELDGARLGSVAGGTFKLGGALLAFGPFAVYGWAAGMAMNSLADGIVKLNAVDPVKLEKVAMAMQKVKDATPTLGESIKAGVSNIIGKITGTANITSTATPPPTNAVTYAPGPVETPIKNLQVDIRELHTTMREVLKYVKETADHAKRNVDATKALNSNGFPTTS